MWIPWLFSLMFACCMMAHAVEMSPDGADMGPPILLEYAPLKTRPGWFEPKKLRWHAQWHRVTPFAAVHDPSPTATGMCEGYVMDCHRLKGGFAALPGSHPSVLGGLGRPSHTRLRMQLDAKRRAMMFKRSVSGRVGARTSGADGWMRANRMRAPHSDSGAKREAVQHFSRAGKTVTLSRQHDGDGEKTQIQCPGNTVLLRSEDQRPDTETHSAHQHPFWHGEAV